MVKAVYKSRAGEGRGPQYTPGRTFQVAEDIIPIADFKSRMSEIVRGLPDRRPLVVTLNGQPAAVVMSPAEFDRLTYQLRVLKGIVDGLADVADGNTITSTELRRRIKQRYGGTAKTR